METKSRTIPIDLEIPRPDKSGLGMTRHIPGNL